MEIQINNKKCLRKQKIDKRGLMDKEEVLSKSEMICKKVLTSDVYINSDVILNYCDYNNEVCTKFIFEKALSDGKSIAYPVCTFNDNVPGMEFYFVDNYDKLCVGYKGILEPDYKNNKLVKYNNESALCIVPCTVFDDKCHRIGYGMGFYDRFLADRSNVNTIGLAYELQKTDYIDKDSNDIDIGMFITESNIYCVAK